MTLTPIAADDSPSAPSERLITLDVIRGIAVIGILAMNIVSFALPSPAIWNPLAGGGTATADIFAYLVAFVFVDGKMRGLFSLLFGASMVLMADRNRAQGVNAKPVQRRRLAVLAVIGLAHYYLLWHGDILFLYAIVGVFLLWFIDRSGERLIHAAIMAFITAFIIQVLMAVGMIILSGLADLDPNQYASDYRALLAALGGDNDALNGEIAAVTGSYADAVGWRTSAAMWSGPFDGALLNGIETLALMLTGAGLQRSGFFRGDWPAVTYRTIIRRYGGIAVAMLSLMAAVLALWGFPPVATYATAYGWSQPFDWMMTIAYAAVLVRLVQPRPQATVSRYLAATGRMAFTNYLLSSVLMTSLFYGYGAGWFGSWSRAALYGIVVVVAVAMPLWSMLWLRRFGQGPLERLWRRLAMVPPSTR